MLFHATLADVSVDVYTTQAVLRLGGVVDRDRLHAAAAATVQRYSNLRAAFHTGIDGTPVQVIVGSVELPWTDVDLRADGNAEVGFAELVTADRLRHFGLAEPPLIRFTFVRLPGSRHALVVSNHHILLDGWSLPLLVKDLLMLYASRSDDSVLAPARSYRTFLAWVREQDAASSADAWRTALDGVEAPTLLAPAARGREITTLSGEDVFELDVQVTARVSALSRELGVTVNTVLQVAWGVVLGHHVGSDDVVFGTTVSGRPVDLPAVESMVGLFINTIPVRVRLGAGAAVRDVLSQVQGEQAELLDHHHLGLADIQSAAGVGDLFDTLIVFESYPIDTEGLKAQAASIDGMTIDDFETADATHYPLTLIVTLDDRLHFRVGYLRDLLDRATVAAIM